MPTNWLTQTSPRHGLFRSWLNCLVKRLAYHPATPPPPPPHPAPAQTQPHRSAAVDVRSNMQRNPPARAESARPSTAACAASKATGRRRISAASCTDPSVLPIPKPAPHHPRAHQGIARCLWQARRHKRPAPTPAPSQETPGNRYAAGCSVSRYRAPATRDFMVRAWRLASRWWRLRSLLLRRRFSTRCFCLVVMLPSPP